MVKGRRDLLELVTIMARYTMQMSSDDCGGMSDYVEFFTACRNVFNIKETRKELQTELTEVLRLVENNFFLEERTHKKIKKKIDEEYIARKNRFDILVAVLTAITLPAVLLSGIFGMNNYNIPTSVDWYTVLYFSGGISILLFVVFLGLMQPWRNRKSARRRLIEEKTKQLAEDEVSVDALYKSNYFNHFRDRTNFTSSLYQPHSVLRKRRGAAAESSAGSISDEDLASESLSISTNKSEATNSIKAKGKH
jgi:hypothetical protein